MKPITVVVQTFVLLTMHPNLIQTALYEISMDSLEPDPNSDASFIDYGTLRVSKKSRNLFVIAGYFEYLQNLDDDTKVMYAIYLNDNKKPMISGEKGYCQVLEGDSGVMHRLRELSNLPPPGTCPFPRGKYTINNYELDETQLPIAVPPGQYSLVIKMVEANQVKAGYTIKVTIK
ncbi:uncharacterized protein LOC120416193 [Culex pipiens pallens]|uniref:uncharacterized protein LOC120416193 n=1 Tax=Culex pipiens pallens TaxID=42434 RepID=UPI00195465BE|nr:uncharacterized protein LOC120416193 [Culex pipiens pallens]